MRRPLRISRMCCMTRPCWPEGGELDDPAIFVRRVNRLIVEGLSAAAQNHSELSACSHRVSHLPRMRASDGGLPRRATPSRVEDAALLDAYSGAVIGALERVAPAVTFIEVAAPDARNRRGRRARRRQRFGFPVHARRLPADQQSCRAWLG